MYRRKMKPLGEICALWNQTVSFHKEQKVLVLLIRLLFDLI